MADDNSARHRTNDAYGRGPSQAAPANDPLAELARLIGQNDPFSEYGRDARPQAVQQPEASRYENDPAPSYDINAAAPQYGSVPPQHYSEPEPEYHEPAPQPQYQQPAVRPPEPQPSQRAQPLPRPPEWPRPQSQPYGQGVNEPRFAASTPAPRNDWPGSPGRPAYPPSDPFALPSDNQEPQARSYDSRGNASPSFPSQNYPSQNYPSQNYPSQPQNYPGQTYPAQSYPDPLGLPSDYAQPEPTGYQPAGYPVAQDRQGFQPPSHAHQPDAGAMPPPNDDEYYDDEPRSGRRKGLLTVAAVLALAVVGTAGAFGYRSIFGNSGTSGPPPVIRASGEPSKVAPPPANIDQAQGKFSYDRFGDAGKDEKVVGREEKPVDVSKIAAPPPRTVFPGAPVANSPSSKTSGTTAATNPPSAIGEPRRVRTVPIRPDQADGAATQTPAQQPTSAAPPRQANAAPSPPSNRQASAPVANAPLSLSPDANALSPGAQESAPPTSRSSRIATAPAASAPASVGGSYLVQVSSQRSEAEAETAYRGIQSKYSGVLGSQPHTVRRADLGAKGVYYRAMVGPFASRDQAVQVCSSLKQAGGECVVQH